VSATRRRRVYVDTSAYLSVLLGETNAGRIADAADGAAFLSSVPA